MGIAFIYEGNFTVDVENFTFGLCKFAHPDDSLRKLSGLLDIAKGPTFLLFTFLSRILHYVIAWKEKETSACFPAGA